ncbi:hypothetical protein [Roseovarius sp. A-2]|uniref:hypothetical protein n=1 Tax=Roseovarius sp. A-2 TaxID=1570360 RepID=UPI0009B5215F|nr:hypothetical protein [Roseovarius sp. A-2]
MTGTPVENDAREGQGGSWNLWLGLVVLGFVALCLTVWFPQDIGSGFMQKNLTGRTVPGDAFFPVLLVGLMVPLAILLIFSQLRPRPGASGEPVGHVGADNLVFLILVILLTGMSIMLMNLTGPAVVWLTNKAGLTAFSGYRAASATFPFNVSGFVVGGFLLICGFIRLTCRRLSLLHVLVALGVVLMLVLVFDILLENVHLPPNADL